MSGDLLTQLAARDAERLGQAIDQALAFVLDQPEPCWEVEVPEAWMAARELLEAMFRDKLVRARLLDTKMPDDEPLAAPPMETS
jgi:hypothetical protein